MSKPQTETQLSAELRRIADRIEKDVVRIEKSFIENPPRAANEDDAVSPARDRGEDRLGTIDARIQRQNSALLSRHHCWLAQEQSERDDVKSR